MHCDIKQLCCTVKPTGYVQNMLDKWAIAAASVLDILCCASFVQAETTFQNMWYTHCMAWPWIAKCSHQQLMERWWHQCNKLMLWHHCVHMPSSEIHVIFKKLWVITYFSWKLSWFEFSPTTSICVSGQVQHNFYRLLQAPTLVWLSVQILLPCLLFCLQASRP